MRDTAIRTVPVSPGDEPFLFELYASTRREEVAAWGWDPAQQDAFLHMQFKARHKAYEWQYPEADHRLILLGETAVGRIMVDRTGPELVLVDITLLPNHRGAGTGTALIRQLQTEARQVGKPLHLRVLLSSPARRLYERLGFAPTADDGTYCAMEWCPDPNSR